MRRRLLLAVQALESPWVGAIVRSVVYLWTALPVFAVAFLLFVVPEIPGWSRKLRSKFRRRNG